MAEGDEPIADVQDPQNAQGTSQEDLDASIDADVNPTATGETATQDMAVDGAKDATADATTEGLPTLETRIPAKKDASLREFLGKMDDYAPIVSLPLYLPILQERRSKAPCALSLTF